MPKTKQEKEKTVEDLWQKLDQMKTVVFFNFKGLGANDTDELRKACQLENIDYLVAKKTLLKLALEKAGVKDIPELAGGIAVALGYEDEILPAKILDKFSKDHEALKIVGGILENKFVDSAGMINLAKISSRPGLLAKMVGSIQAPISGFVNVLKGNLRNLVYILNAIKDSKS